MKKTIIFLLGLLCSWSVLQAVPALRGLVNVTQSDGTTIAVETVGDEFYHCFITQDGLTVARADNGDFYYQTSLGTSALMAHNPGERSAVELKYIENNRHMMTLDAIKPARLKANKLRSVGTPQIPSSGSPRVPILLVGFDDIKMKHSVEDFDVQFHTGAKSVLQYFVDQSNGQYTPQYDLYGIYNVSQERAHYGIDSIAQDYYLHEMVIEAVDLSDDEVDWSVYDNDGDGEVDVCIVLYAGVSQAQASMTHPDAIWPCQSGLDWRAEYGIGTGHIYRDGVKIDRFAVFAELNGPSDEGTVMDGIGTFCHEFSHCLGLPDWYETTYGHGYFGMGDWSLMDHGCYNGTFINGDTPVGYNAYEKNFMGWLDFTEPQENTRYNLPVFNSGNDQALKIVSPLNDNEYFIVENRAKQGWDIHIPDEGVLITHFTYIPERWADNTPNNEAIQLATIVPADGSASDYNMETDLYGETNHNLTDETLPAANLNMNADGTLASVAGGAGFLGKSLTDIFLNDDKSATLWFMRADVPQVEAPVMAEATNVTSSSFKASWIHESDIPVTYTLRLNHIKKATELISESFAHLAGGESNISNKLDQYCSNAGWTGSNLFEGDGCLIMSSRNFPGRLKSPALDLSESEGTMTVIFTAASDGEGTTNKLTVNNGLTSQSISLNDAPKTYAMVLDCNASADQYVTLSAERNKRVLLYDVAIYNSDASALVDEPLMLTASSDDVQTIMGITDKNYTVKGLIAGDTYKFEVQAVPVDINIADESEWSNQCSVTLPEGGITGDVDGDSSVNISDVTALIDYLLTGNASGISLSGADCNQDGNINISDVTSLIDYLLSGTWN